MPGVRRYILPGGCRRSGEARRRGFCAAVDWVVAVIIGFEIVAGIHFRP
jgi:hypothetical protein